MAVRQDQTDRLKHIDLVKLAERYTTLEHESAREYSGPCPVCGGTDRFHCTETWWFCRQCHPRRDDAIAFVRLVERLSFPDACEWLDRYAGGHGPALAPAAPRVPEQKRAKSAPRWDSDTWQIAARRQVDAAAFRLETLDGEPGRAYLAGRGITAETWRAWRLGYHLVRWKRPGSSTVEPLGWAIALPWLGPDGTTIKAIQYRLLEPAMIGGKTKRFHQRAGGERTLFGAHLVDPKSKRTLVLCEGELNAVSVWQVGRDLGVDAVSWGPQDNISFAARYMAALARRYERVIVWADEPERAIRAVEAAGGHAVALRSPRGLDANDLLQRGLLTDFLARWLGRIGAGAPEIAHKKMVEPAESLYRAVMNECERLYQCGDMAAAGEIEEAATLAFIAGDVAALADVLTGAVQQADDPSSVIVS